MKKLLYILLFLPILVFGQTIEKHPKYGDWNKPTSLNDPGLVAAYNMIPSAGGVLTDISGNSNTGTINGPISTVDGLVFDGIDDDITFASAFTLNKAYSIVFRVKPNYTGVQIIIGDQSSAANFIFFRQSDNSIEMYVNSTLYDFGNTTVTNNQIQNIVIARNGTNIELYVNGINEGTITLDGADNIDMNVYDVIGSRQQSLYLPAEIENFKIYNYQFTQQQAQDYHNSFAKRVVLIDNFEYDAVGSVPREWQIESGTFAIAEDATSKYISCTGNGNIVFHGVDLSSYFESGWIKTLTGDLSGDQDDTVDNATNLAYSNGKLTVTMTSGQKLRELIIIQGED